MNTKLVARPALLAAALLLTGCAGTPEQGADRTPSWMKHQEVGTRIPRVSDRKGDASSASTVVTTTEEGLEDLPSVVMRRCRTTWYCN